jgi:hypothetical protein
MKVWIRVSEGSKTMSEGKGVTKVNGVTEYKLFAGGEWRAADGNRLFDVYQPYDRVLYARVADGRRAEAKIAVDAAAQAFPVWSQSTPAECARLFFKAAEIVKRRRAEIAQILAQETGSTISFATFSKISLPPPSSRLPAGCTSPRARFWQAMFRGPTRSACEGHSVWWRASRPGTAPTSCPGVPSSRRSPRATRSS